jgi:hypothetical protein
MTQLAKHLLAMDGFHVHEHYLTLTCVDAEEVEAAEASQAERDAEAAQTPERGESSVNSSGRVRSGGVYRVLVVRHAS